MWYHIIYVCLKIVKYILHIFLLTSAVYINIMWYHIILKSFYIIYVLEIYKKEAH